jgi:hypothetical protein
MAQLSSEKTVPRRAASHDKGTSSMQQTHLEHCMSMVDVLQARGGDVLQARQAPRDGVSTFRPAG